MPRRVQFIVELMAMMNRELRCCRKQKLRIRKEVIYANGRLPQEAD